MIGDIKRQRSFSKALIRESIVLVAHLKLKCHPIAPRCTGSAESRECHGDFLHTKDRESRARDGRLDA